MYRAVLVKQVVNLDGEVLGHRYLWTYGGDGRSDIQGWLLKEATIRAATVVAFRFMLDTGAHRSKALNLSAIMGQTTEDRVLTMHLLTQGLAGDALIQALTAVCGEELVCEREAEARG